MIRAALAVLLICCSIGGAAEPTRFEVYPLGGADMESTLEAVRHFIGNEGQVTPDPVHQRLLVVTTPERHARIADLMNKLAGPPRNVLIEVQMRTAGQDTESELSVGGGGDLTVERDGLSGTITLRPKVVHQTTTRSGTATQSLLVGSGREAFLRVGESVPYLDWITDYGIRGGIISTRLNWQQVGSFLVVQPTIIGDGPEIRVRITPELRGLVNGRPEHVRFSTLTTDVLARDGESMNLGGVGQQSEFFSRFLVGAGRGGAGESIEIRLTPRIQPISAPPRAR